MVKKIVSFLFLRKLNLFDLLTLVIVNSLIVNQSWWYAFLYLPAIIISVLMEMRLNDL